MRQHSESKEQGESSISKLIFVLFPFAYLLGQIIKYLHFYGNLIKIKIKCFKKMAATTKMHEKTLFNTHKYGPNNKIPTL